MMRLAIIAVTLLAWGCHAGPSPAEKEVDSTQRDKVTTVVAQSADLGMPLESLAPAIRKSLREIKVVRIDDSNIDAVWNFEASSPQAVLLLECGPEVLSTGRMEKIAAWAKKGHGVIVQAPQLRLSSYLLPSSNYIDIDSSGGDWELAKNSELLRNVQSLRNHFWCVDLSSEVLGGSMSLRVRQVRKEGGGITYSDPYEVVENVGSMFSAHGEEMIPIILGPYDESEESFVLFASTFRSARVLWFAGRIDVSNKECRPQFDDAMLWANLMHWLAGRPLPESGRT